VPILSVLVQGFSSHEIYRRGALAGNLKHWWNGGVLKVGMSSNREQLLFPECSGGGSGFSVYGVVNVPEFLGKSAKLNSNHVPAEMLLAYERHAALLIFLSGHIHQNELLPRFHACR